MAFGETSIYLPFRHTNLPGQNYDLRRFLPYLQDVLDTATVIYHNAKFDLVSLRTLGLRASRGRFLDTMVLAHILDENRPFTGKDLDSCVKFYTNVDGKKNQKESRYSKLLKVLGYAGMSAQSTAEYAAWDAWITLQLYLAIKDKLNQDNLGEVWQHKADMIRLLIDMEGNGVEIDQHLCATMSEEGRAIMDQMRLNLGINPGSKNDLERLLIDELHLPVVKLTPHGKPSFDKYAMAEYEEILERTSDRKAQQILTYRGWQKSCSSNYEPYLNLLSDDGRLRANYLLHGTVTGRMSCRLPNLQQIPRSGVKPWNGKMKQCFVPRKGYVLIEGDYSQLEFRLSSAFAKQQVLLDAFNDLSLQGRDVFQELSDALGMERYEGKTLTYVISYGGGARRIANVFGVSLAEGQSIRDNFFNTYPNLLKASRYAANYATHHKKIPIWSGRYRHFLNVKEEAHKAYNSLVQGGAADIVERAMVRCWKEGLNVDDCRMLLQVHDSIVFEVREEVSPYFKIIIRECMQRVDPNFGVRFKVDVHEWGS